MPYYSDMIKVTAWFVYVVGEFSLDGAGTGFYKIGSSSNVTRRISGLRCGNPRLLRVVWQKDYGSRGRAMGIEKMAHKFVSGWVNDTEWFECELPGLIHHINLCEQLFDSGDRHCDFVREECRI